MNKIELDNCCFWGVVAFLTLVWLLIGIEIYFQKPIYWFGVSI